MKGITTKMYRMGFVVAALLCMVWTSCGNKEKQAYTVGVINVVPDLDQALEGFKEGMTELGYVEGKNIRYVYDGATTDMGKLPAVAQKLVAEKVDLILTMTTPATKAAQQATAGLELPVVFAVVTDPVGAGIVESLKHPGGNITGVVFGSQEERRFEWLIRIAPKIKQVYIPFNPKDQSPVLSLKAVRPMAEKLGIKLISIEVGDSAALDDAISNIPSEADAIFNLPDSFVSARLPDLVAAANARKLPVSGANVTVVKNNDVLTSFGFDQHLAGKQAARLADQIFKGAKPADLPAEMVEFFLAINLKAAEAIGLSIPDTILRQANIIVR
ncbi:MAG TPA: hypothetical protein DIC34_11815 [Treponema sp.]|nr:MAG: hypothetical protein A2Y36_02585 [Treponema sp. GWA1_62_8]OHE66791.1 MAG: hypothetical protein A2001_13395 [Treponema sp. GWC1_61_84]OHE75342.1 MAG: hypothetical protein A2413_07950 [Treponema sp. RIFOXYC1_FULL_61_9]HCM27210.1 hypothetical protein [Treponema sp.]